MFPHKIISLFSVPGNDLGLEVSQYQDDIEVSVSSVWWKVQANACKKVNDFNYFDTTDSLLSLLFPEISLICLTFLNPQTAVGMSITIITINDHEFMNWLMNWEQLKYKVQICRSIAWTAQSLKSKTGVNQRPGKQKLL